MAKNVFREGRKGPIKEFPYGKYKGRPLLDIMEEDPGYVIWCIKTYLDLSPMQARYFEEMVGGEIPEQYINRVKVPPSKRKDFIPKSEDDFSDVFGGPSEFD